MPRVDQSAVRNRLLATLPPDAFAAPAPALERVGLGFKEILHEPGRPLRHLHFLEGGLVSHVIPLETGHAAEVGVVGREGMVGVAAVLGARRAAMEVMVQLEAPAWRVSSSALREVADGSAAARGPLLRYAQAFHAQVAQTAACNAHHQVDARLARWVLMTHDRADGDAFVMTHEFLALMLGASRPMVSVAAGVLQRSGAIRYVRGRVEVLDRAMLEAASCECYGVVQEQFDELLGAPAG